MAGDMDGALAAWETADGRLLAKLEQENTFVYVLAISPRGTLAAQSVNDRPRQRNELRIWRLTRAPLGLEWRAVERLATPVPVGALVFAPDGRRLLGARVDGSLVAWSVTSWAQTGFSQESETSLHGLFFSPRGDLVAGCDGKGTVSVWDPVSLALSKTLTATTVQTPFLCFAPDGKNAGDV